MSQALNNPSSSTHRDYGATASSAATPEISFAGPSSSSGNSGINDTELISLSNDINNKFDLIKSSTDQLKKHQKLMATGRNVSKLLERIHNINTSTNLHIQTCSQDLQRMQAVVRHGDRRQKLQLERFMEQFQIIVENFSIQQNSVSKATRLSYQLAVEAEREAEMNERTDLIQQQRQDQAGLEREHDMLAERLKQVEQIETDIINCNTIMNKLSTMIHEQGEDLERIEIRTTEAADAISDAESTLQKTATMRNSHRRKILILLLIAVIIGLIVTGIIVSKLS